MTRLESRSPHHGSRGARVVAAWCCAAALLAAGGGTADRDATTGTVLVLDGESRGIAGARVALFSREEDGAWERIAGAATDDEGLAELVPLPVAPSVLSISSPGFVPRTIEIGPGDVLERTVELSRGRGVTLRAIDGLDGRPVLAFEVLPFPVDPRAAGPERLPLTLEGLDSQRFATEDGSARVTGLPRSGPFGLLVRAAGYPPVVTTVAGGERELSVELDASGCVRRRVVDAETGSPVKGVRAAASPSQISGPLARVAPVPVSDENGRLAVCPSAAAGWRVILAHEGYAPALLDLAGGRDAEPDLDGSLAIARGGRLTGIVFDADRVPLPGASVTARYFGLQQRVDTGRDGSFAFELLPSTTVTLEATAPDDGRSILARQAARVRRGETSVIELSAQPRLRVVATREAEPLAGVDLVLLDGASGIHAEPVAVATTDELGTARLARPGGLSSEEQLVLRRSSWLAFMPLPKPSPDADEAERRVELAGRFVRGRVVEASGGDAVEGATVRCIRGGGALRIARGGETDHPLRVGSLKGRLQIDGVAVAAVSDERGTFEMPLPPWCDTPRVIGPLVDDDEPPFSDRGVDAGEFPDDGTLEIELERGSALVAFVVGPGGLPPSRPATVGLRRPGDAQEQATASVAGGRARFRVAEDGPWLVVARSAGLAPAVEGPLDVRAAEATRAHLRLVEGGLVVVEGLPAHAAGPGRRWKLLDSRGIDWSSIAPVEPAESGALEIGPLPPDRYTLVAGELRAEVRIRFSGDTRVVKLEP